MTVELQKVNIPPLEENLTNIADAIRNRNITWNKYSLTELPAAINDIQKSSATYNALAGKSLNKDVVLSDDVMFIEAYAFYDQAITGLRANNVIRVRDHAFYSCNNLKKLIIKGKDAYFDTDVIRYCNTLEELRIPNACSSFTFGSNGLQSCSSLKIIDYGFATSLVFNSLSAANLNTIILHKTDGVQALSSSTILNSTKFKEGGEGGTVYIPEVMYNHLGDGSELDYKAATNWVTYNGYGTITWAILEDSIYDEPETTPFNYKITEISKKLAPYSGSGTERTSSIIDATEGEAWYEVPFDSESAYLANAAIEESVVACVASYLYKDAECTDFAGVYWFSTNEIKTSGGNQADRPYLSFNKKTLLVPQGYYAKIHFSRAGAAQNTYSSNANMESYLKASAPNIKIKKYEKNLGLPIEYQEVEWIQSDKTNHITTNLYLFNNYPGFDIKFISYDNFTNTANSYGCILGTRTSSNSKDFQLTTYKASSNSWSGTLRSGGSSQNYNALLNAKGEINQVSYIGTTYTVNGTSYTRARGSVNNTRRITLFGLNDGGSIAQQGAVRCFYCKFYDGTTLVHDFIPCYRKSDGQVGMYDLQSRTFYYQFTGNDFIKGPDVSPINE